MARPDPSAKFDVLSGVAALVVVGLASFEASTFPLQSLEDGLGAAFFPYLTLGAISLLGVALIVKGLASGALKGTAEQTDSSAGAASSATSSLLRLFVLFGAFAMAFGYFGLLAPAIIFLVVAMRILGAPWAGAAIVGCAAGCALYALFVFGFGVPMP